MSPEKENSNSSGSKESVGDFEHVVFLGTFNADPFKSKITRWLTALDLSGTALVIGDNNSADGTVDWMKDLVGSLETPAFIQINKRNLGGYGNLATNLPFFKAAKWVTTLHQDDEYLPRHVQNHRRVIKGSPSNLGMICSEAKSIAPDGYSIGYPRAHWLLENRADPVTTFIAHLKNHAYPFSGATFLKQALLDFPIPWHSTAFPDTEIVMKLAVDYSVAFAQGVTVRYLENPNSESHSLAPQHRDFGAFQALLRVFAHPNYKRLCDLVPEREISKFLAALEDGISQRFQDPEYSNLMKQAVFEITAQHLGTGPEMATRLSAGYSRVGDVRALEILSALGAEPREALVSKSKEPIHSRKDVSNLKNNALVQSLSSLLPRSVRKFMFKALMRSKIGREKLGNWDFDWRRL